ncbi:uncharacterized protein LY89DRAFT_257183 [Mollisia scopiformis]|uniref:Uncharacterized protein n=1 Tax=Mollisia scopiformis TaxID=149040 RepID=A0A132BD01_MOLSC|nr:uncharacterized protein LY89DRAFT_257183 [Mollisia scopiformis]KUJ10305.1 hypothetical protein LY89DRAFT_257183 [Mollisia scopiformis]
MRPFLQRTESANPSQTLKSLDPDISSSYFLVRRATNDSPAASPGLPIFITPSSKSPSAKSHKAPKSTTSNRSKATKTRGNSVSSALSVSSKYRHIAEWNEKSSSGISPGAVSPVSFETQRHPADPPRPPKPGLEWVWFPDGYWAEREVRDGSRVRQRQASLPRQKWWNRSPDKSKKGSIGTDDLNVRKVEVPKIKIGSLTSGKTRSASSDGKTLSRHSSRVETLGGKLGGFRFLKTETVATTLDQPNEQLGLYCRTKKEIKKRLLAPRTPKSVSPQM